MYYTDIIFVFLLISFLVIMLNVEGDIVFWTFFSLFWVFLVLYGYFAFIYAKKSKKSKKKKKKN